MKGKENKPQKDIKKERQRQEQHNLKFSVPYRFMIVKGQKEGCCFVLFFSPGLVFPPEINTIVTLQS